MKIISWRLSIELNVIMCIIWVLILRMLSSSTQTGLFTWRGLDFFSAIVDCWGSCIFMADKITETKLLRKTSSVLEMALDTVQEVRFKKKCMVAKLSSLLENNSLSLYEAVTPLSSSFSERPLHPKSLKEKYWSAICVWLRVYCSIIIFVYRYIAWFVMFCVIICTFLYIYFMCSNSFAHLQTLDAAVMWKSHHCGTNKVYLILYEL